MLAAAAMLTMRRFIFTNEIPAGTDMLGFISRAAQNATLNSLTDAWSPSSSAHDVSLHSTISSGLNARDQKPDGHGELLMS